jgi:hypothetical protein
MGFNPLRPHRTSRTDFVIVGAALVVTALLVLWAFGAF